MKKLVNLRLPVLFAAVLIFGAVAGYCTIYFNFNYVWLTVTAIAVAASLIIFCILKCTKKTLICVCLCVFIFAVGAVNCGVRLTVYQQSQLIGGTKYQITGTVAERTQLDGGVGVVLRNVTADGKKLNCKIYAVIHESITESCDLGNVLTFYTEVEENNAFEYGNFKTDAADNVKYYCLVFGGVTSRNEFNLFGSVNTAISNALFSNLDYSTASLAFSMLTGNSSVMEEQTLTAFRYGGVAHIFAVSGLHIGIIFSFVTFILKKLRINKYISAAVSIALIFMYSGVCGFTSSSLRAVVMCAVLAVSKLIHGKYDGLNSLSVAAIIILLINPLRLFTLGFQLSFCAMASIFLWQVTFSRLFKFLPQKLRAPISVSFSVQAGTLPVMLLNFGYLSIAGLFLNVIAIPVLSMLFVLLFVCTFLSIIITPLAGLFLPFSATPLQFVTSLFIEAGFENAILRVGGIAILTPLWYFLLLFLTDKINLRLPIRAALSTACAAVMAVLCVLSAFSPLSGVTVCVTANYNGEGTVFKYRGESALVLTEDSQADFLLSVQNKYSFSPFKAVIILGGEDGFYETVLNLSSVSQKIYLSPANISIVTAGLSNVYYEKDFTLCDTEFSFLDEYTLVAQSQGVKTVISAAESGYQLNNVNCDLLVSNQVLSGVNCNTTVYFSLTGYKYNIYNFGDLIFRLNNGKIKKKGVLPVRDCLN